MTGLRVAEMVTGVSMAVASRTCKVHQHRGGMSSVVVVVTEFSLRFLK